MAIDQDDVLYALFELEQVTMTAERLAHFFRADVATIQAHLMALEARALVHACYINVAGGVTAAGYALSREGALAGQAISAARAQ